MKLFFEYGAEEIAYLKSKDKKLGSGIRGSEMPIDSFLKRITLSVPSGQLRIEKINGWDTPVHQDSSQSIRFRDFIPS